MKYGLRRTPVHAWQTGFVGLKGRSRQAQVTGKLLRTMGMLSLVLVLLLLAAVFAWRAARAGRGARRRAVVTDADELAAAEKEVQELDAFTRPEDADDQLPDWGPGAGPR